MSDTSWAYIDGAFVPSAEAHIAADDAGMLHGHGLYETFRAHDGRVYLLDRHGARLRSGAATLGIDVPADVARLAEIVSELAERCGLSDARVRLTLTAGPEDGQPSMLLQARPATDYPEQLYERGVTAMIASLRRNETSPLANVKSLGHFDNLLARRNAREAGADQALLLNTRGFLAEASSANVFVVRDGSLATPPISDGALPGVTRGAVLELASAAGISAEEASLAIDDLHRADEAFITNAIAGVLPLVVVDGRNVGPGKPGEMTRRVRALYEEAAAA